MFGQSGPRAPWFLCIDRLSYDAEIQPVQGGHRRDGRDDAHHAPSYSRSGRLRCPYRFQFLCCTADEVQVSSFLTSKLRFGKPDVSRADERQELLWTGNTKPACSMALRLSVSITNVVQYCSLDIGHNEWKLICVSAQLLS